MRALLLLLAACEGKFPQTDDGDDTPVDPASWRGVWGGLCPLPDYELDLEWAVQSDDDGSLIGDAELEYEISGQQPIEVEGQLLGSYEGDAVEAAMLFDGYEVLVAGERTGEDEITADCEFAGDTAAVTLRR